MKILFLLTGTILLFPPASIVSAQDSVRIGIHQLESNLHYWDKIKCDSAVPEFLHGKESAAAHRFTDAERSFRKALKTNKPDGYYNLGVLHTFLRNDAKALEYFRRSYQLQKDSICLEEIRKAEQRCTAKKERK